MADKSKRAKTSVPRTEEQKAAKASTSASKPKAAATKSAKKAPAPSKASTTKAPSSTTKATKTTKKKEQQQKAEPKITAKKTAVPVVAKEAPASALPASEQPSSIPEAPPPPPAVPSSASPKKKPAKKKTSKLSATSRSSSLPLKQYEFIGVPSFKGVTVESRPAVPAPPPPALRELTLEERLEVLQSRLAQQSEGLRKQLQEQLDMSWIYHDSALEGVVYSFQELKTALGPDQTLVQESNLQPVIDEIRRHRAAIELVRECAKKKTPITLDLIKRIYLTLHPEEGDLKTVKYRKDIPQHRLYFHEYAAPDKIAGKVRQVVDWLNEPEAQKGRNALRVAARAHYDLLRAFPFQTDSGKVARLLMNLLLLQSGYEPAILHSTERQRYYDALKGSAPTIISMVVEAEENAVMSLEKLLDELELRGRGYAG